MIKQNETKNGKQILTFSELLKKDYVGKSIMIIQSEKNVIEEIIITNYKVGILEYRNQKVEIHKWENEEELEIEPYSKNKYTLLLSDGFAPNIDGYKMVEEIQEMTNTEEMAEKDKKLVKKGIKLICKVLR